MAVMDDFSQPRVQAHAAAALVNFSEACEQVRWRQDGALTHTYNPTSGSMCWGAGATRASQKSWRPESRGKSQLSVLGAITGYTL